MSIFTPEKQAQARAASLLLAQRVREYFKNPDHRRAFEIWYLNRYEKPYVWIVAKTGGVDHALQ